MRTVALLRQWGYSGRRSGSLLAVGTRDSPSPAVKLTTWPPVYG